MNILEEINKLLPEVLSQKANTASATVQSTSRLQSLLQLDDANFSVFLMLHRKFAQRKAVQTHSEQTDMWIYDAVSSSVGDTIAYSVPDAPARLQKFLSIAQLEEIEKLALHYEPFAKTATLIIMKMQAGTGSSFERTRYISENFDRTKLGAKGTDLLMEIEDPADSKRKKKIPLVEAQILQMIQTADQYKGIIFHDIASAETLPYIDEIWQKSSVIDSSLSYENLIKKTPHLFHSNKTLQAHIPALDKEGQLTFNRKAPGGHALFFVDAMRAVFKPALLPKPLSEQPIAVISNGEDLASNPNAALVGWMVEGKRPFVLISTDKTGVDEKGGFLGIIDDLKQKVSPYLSVVETAQAERSGQLELFKNLKGYINTNQILINFLALSEEVQRRGISENEFMQAVSPNLIENWKTQIDPDGEKRRYLQLEGAMGSSLMNLDRYWRERFGTPLVHIVNVSQKDRTEFFAPIKSAFDYWMQFHSDRFGIDSKRIRLINHRPGFLPKVTLKDPESSDKFYQDVSNVMETFEGTSILHLDSLEVTGRVSLSGFTLKGDIRIVCRSKNQVDLMSVFRDQKPKTPLVLENVSVTIGPGTELFIESMAQLT